MVLAQQSAQAFQKRMEGIVLCLKGKIYGGQMKRVEKQVQESSDSVEKKSEKSFYSVQNVWEYLKFEKHKKCSDAGEKKRNRGEGTVGPAEVPVSSAS